MLSIENNLWPSRACPARETHRPKTRHFGVRRGTSLANRVILAASLPHTQFANQSAKSLERRLSFVVRRHDAEKMKQVLFIARVAERNIA